MKHMGAIFSIFCLVSQAFSQNYFFYSFQDDPWTFERRNSDGSSKLTVYTPPAGTVMSSAEDASINKVYYYDNYLSGGGKAILRSNYDGSSQETFLSVSANVSIAAGNGYLYYAYSASPYTLRRVNSNGTGDVQIYLNPSYGQIEAVALDIQNNYLYFYERAYDNVNNRIARTDLNGSNLTTVYTTTAVINCLTAGNGYFFFSPSVSPWTFRRRNADGTNEQVVYTPPTGEVKCCSYDEALNKIYFYDTNPKAIYLSDIDGSNQTTVYSGFTQVVTSLSAPKKNTVLPVELTLFTALAKEKGVELVWKTATEVNNFGFEIEKKAVSSWLLANSQQQNANGWSKIGFVEGNGTTNAPKSYSFVDVTASGKIAYRLKQIDRDGKFSYSQSVEVTVASVPKVFALKQNYPNPFNPTTVISYQLPENSNVTLKVYDAVGREVATLVDEMKEAGSYTLQFDGAKLSSGVYFYKLQAGNFTAVKKLTLMK